MLKSLITIIVAWAVITGDEYLASASASASASANKPFMRIMSNFLLYRRLWGIVQHVEG